MFKTLGGMFWYPTKRDGERISIICPAGVPIDAFKLAWSIADVLSPLNNDAPWLETIQKGFPIDGHGGLHSEDLTDGDWDLLKRLIGLTRDIADKCTQEEMNNYRASLDGHPDKPKWNLIAYFRDPALDSANSQANIRNAQIRAIEDAARKRDITLINYDNRSIVGKINSATKAAMIFEDAGKYLKSIGIGLEREPAPTVYSATEVTPVVGSADFQSASKQAAEIPIKKEALIPKLRSEWDCIENDFNEASRNGLKEYAHAEGMGMWYESKCRQWAESKGKIRKSVQVAQPTWSGRVHKIE